MKLLLTLLCITAATTAHSREWIRINQAGYHPDGIKTAVFAGTIVRDSLPSFEVRNALTDEVVLISQNVKRYGAYGAFASTYTLDFSNITKPGAYVLSAGGVRSPVIRISDDVYNGMADFLLRYMRQQRCGFNPFLNDSCHTNDGFIIYHPTMDSLRIDVTGGWHDASDYLQYVTTSATATYQMLFAYQQNPDAFGDQFLANGMKGSNGIPDILDEAVWGLQWLIKMNPRSDMFFNQIADDRDHRGFRLPTEDTVYYGKGKERPVYFINGTPQGIYQHKNRTTGKASTVAKFSSAFAIGAEVLKDVYPRFAESLLERSKVAYYYAKRFPGVSQTAPCRAPYFYEEDNWVDDMELAAVQLFRSTQQDLFRSDAVRFGEQEPVTPWLGADTASHYQWYPFLNLGHAQIALLSDEHSEQFIGYLRDGIEKVSRRASTNAFNFGIPFIWCSNNLVSSFLSQLYLYRSITKDSSYLRMETSLLDWLFGCNPWGTSMIVGLPSHGDTPVDPHSAFTHVYGYPIDGGLIDGPVRASIFEQHKKYIRLTKEDPYAPFQSDLAVYHDDWGDYTNNEPTMDGTAGLTIYLSSLHRQQSADSLSKHAVTQHGGIVRFDTTKKIIYLLFTGDEFEDGGETIRTVLKKHSIRASFFFTGNFYRAEKNASLIRGLIGDGHYLGAHSDNHLLYASWEKRDSLLVTFDQFAEDLSGNYKAMKQFGITPEKADLFLPPFEWYNQRIADWTKQLGLTLINFSPGTSSNADYTIPGMKNYLPSDSIYSRILRHESQSTNGLNGFLLLTHVGTDERRTDKFYNVLDPLISELLKRGYSFSPVR